MKIGITIVRINVTFFIPCYNTNFYDVFQNNYREHSSISMLRKVSKKITLETVIRFSVTEKIKKLNFSLTFLKSQSEMGESRIPS